MFTPALGFHAPPDRDIREGLDAVPLTVLRVPSGTDIPHDVQIRDLAYLGSYHWMESDTPTFVVPGCPRRWLNKRLPFTVTADKGRSYLSENEHHMPGNALVPLLRAVDLVEEEADKDPFKWHTVDLVTDRRGMRKLLRWINGKADRNFRIDTQLAGSHTVLFNQWEAHTTENASGNFGLTFERATCATSPGCERGHTRIVSYDFDGLKVVLRFNVDAFLPTSSSSTSGSSSPVSVDSLASDLAHLGLELPPRLNAEDAKPDPISGLRVIRTGTADIAQDSLLELTTRSEKGMARFNWAESYPQLFLSQTPNHYLAIHRNGRFRTIVKRKLGSPEMREVERKVQPSLKKLRQILQIVHDLVIEHGETGRLSLVCVGGVLKVFKRTVVDSFLPDQFLSRFHGC
ncbi:hypothetical protein NEOLEDRAFT_1118864 [Neolentinus lepideus HHB14362 ss-1]|uniref:Geranylgeranyl pyrophosphate synthetase n=1 Tax=Neolentinus lepideus HHB14362 ss-1 TaxID=1314782 RepID=A0A165QSC3_9AGAM|nr:hypothetical protein NEOLEDRAFT_1118864 [Neolentinus lepideus HHB14362 ss-1]